MQKSIALTSSFWCDTQRAWNSSLPTSQDGGGGCGKLNQLNINTVFRSIKELRSQGILALWKLERQTGRQKIPVYGKQKLHLEPGRNT